MKIIYAALIIGILLPVSGAFATDCSRESFGAGTKVDSGNLHVLYARTLFESGVAPQRGILAADNTLLITNSGVRQAYIDVDNGSATILWTMPGNTPPSADYQLDHGSDTWNVWRKRIQLSPERLAEIICLANSAWAYRSGAEIKHAAEAEAQSHALDEEQQDREFKEYVKHEITCRKQQLTVRYIDCVNKLKQPQIPQLPYVEIGPNTYSEFAPTLMIYDWNGARVYASNSEVYESEPHELLKLIFSLFD